MTAQALFEVHTFELYGLGRAQLDASRALYGLGPHTLCDLLTFCRNPLHPGPCKGWKHSLKAVAPGVHAEIERARLERVHARREEKRRAARDAGKPEPRFRKLKHERTGDVDRKGQGEGRDADKDGIYNEGEYKKKGRRKKAADEAGPPAEKRLVTLSPETLKAVNDAVKALPKTDAEWRETVQKRVVSYPFAKLVADNKRDLDERKDIAQTRRDQYMHNINAGRGRRGEPPYPSWEEVAKDYPDLGREVAALDQEVKDAQQRYDYTLNAYDEALGQINRLGGYKRDGSLPDGFVAPQGFRAQNFAGMEEWRDLDYPRDAAGRPLPTPEIAALHEKVQRAGAALNLEIKLAIANDPDVARLKQQADEARARFYTVTGEERSRMRKLSTQAGQDAKRRERAIIMDALSQIRPMGGERFSNLKVLSSQSDIHMQVPNASYHGYVPAPPDWQAQFDESAAHFPDDWMRRANEHPMFVVGIERAHMDSKGGDWRKPAGPGRYGVMAMDKGGGTPTGSSSFSSMGSEVTYHESGHWMETNVPGLKALEFAYVRSKTTHNGQVEPLLKIADVQGGGYTPDEVTFRDKFPDAYTGKTYETSTGDPANSPWEAFQVGLQQTFGRGPHKYGEPDLEDFVLGVMATLGRS